MKIVANKFYINDKEVTLVAERFSTKIYKDGDSDKYYITNFDEVVGEFDNPKFVDIDIKCKIGETN